MGASFYRLENVPVKYVQQPVSEYTDKYIVLPYVLDSDKSYKCYIELGKKFLHQNVKQQKLEYNLEKISGIDKTSPLYKVLYFSSIYEIPLRFRHYAPKDDGMIIMLSDGQNIRFMSNKDADIVESDVLVFIENGWQSKGYYIDEFDNFMDKYPNCHIVFDYMLDDFKKCFPEDSVIQSWNLASNEIIYMSM